MKKLKSNELNRISVDEFRSKEKTPIVVVLDNVRSANNVGSLFRTSDAFLIEKLILCGITSTPPNKDIRKTALGAEESVQWEYEKDTCTAIKSLKEQGYTLIGIEQVEGSVFLQEFDVDCDVKYAIVFGNEVKGVQQDVIDLCDHCIEIPQYGTKHSFNVSVTAGIVLWDLFRKMM